MALYQFQAKQLDEFATFSTVAYNNQQRNTTQLSPFYANLGQHPNWNPNNDTANSSSEAATVTVDDITELHHKLSKKIKQQEESTAQ